MRNILSIICLLVVFNCLGVSSKNLIIFKTSPYGPSPVPSSVTRKSAPILISRRNAFQGQGQGPQLNGPFANPTARFFSGFFRPPSPPPPPPPYEWCEEEFDPYFGDWYEVCYPV